MAERFSYRVKDRKGKLHQGELDGDSADAVAARLRDRGLTVLSVESAEAQSLAQKEVKVPGFASKRVKVNDLAVFSRQFAVMINSGLSLLRALAILAEQTENERLAQIIGEVRNDVESGKSLSASLRKHPQFPKLYTAMVRAGESAGLLDQVLVRLAETLEKDVKLRRKIKSALTYPGVILGLALLLTAGMLIFIVPVFEGMFEDMGGDLPLPTQVLVTTSDALASVPGIAALVATPVLVKVAFSRARRNPRASYKIDELLLRTPVFGGMVHKLAVARFSRNLSVLLRAGVPILTALEITADTVNNGPISKPLTDTAAAVQRGERMAGTLGQSPMFPQMVVQMIAVGEETGQIDTMLEKVADFYDDQVEATTEQLTSLIEPFMMGFLGLLVGGMLIAMYMPIFQVIEMVQ